MLSFRNSCFKNRSALKKQHRQSRIHEILASALSSLEASISYPNLLDNKPLTWQRDPHWQIIWLMPWIIGKSAMNFCTSAIDFLVGDRTSDPMTDISWTQNGNEIHPSLVSWNSEKTLSDGVEITRNLLRCSKEIWSSPLMWVFICRLGDPHSTHLKTTCTFRAELNIQHAICHNSCQIGWLSTQNPKTVFFSECVCSPQLKHPHAKSSPAHHWLQILSKCTDAFLDSGLQNYPTHFLFLQFRAYKPVSLLQSLRLGNDGCCALWHPIKAKNS